MIKRTITLIFIAFLIKTLVFAGDNPIQIKPYGYISYEIIYDTYRSVDTRDGELYLFPKRPEFDIHGNDINKRSKFNMLSVHSRVGMDIKGPDALGAKTSGRIEADFFGTRQEYVRMLRMRQAFVRLNWQTTELILGNTFHPFFVLDCFPNTISFAAAVPFHPLNRSPQLRLTQDFSPGISASLSFIVHGYHNSAGPNDQQRESGLPESVFQLRFGNKSDLLFGMSAGYKFLSPRDITTGGEATDKIVGSYHLQAFSRYDTDLLSIKLEGIYGENLSHFVMIGGYGAKGSPDDFDWSSDFDYTNLRTLSIWTDIESPGSRWQWGLFAGYTENLGAGELYIPIPGLTRYDELHYLFRISPRLLYHSNNLSFGVEYSYYNAVYAEEYDAKGKPSVSMDPAINNHIILMARYSF
ncbi:MAG: hypothetical protein EA393_07625 [Bacteroidetes bacterium]|nr:MAG: hypothetical protein EA393_07625 [Bacteroidota bacterium]